MTKSVQRIAFFAFGIILILAILALALRGGKSITIPAEQTFAQIVERIASSEQNSIEWIACPEELKRSPIEAGDISAADGRLLIESAGKRIPNSTQIKRVILDDKGRKYTIYCN
ncbi:hypothetical protein KKE54_03330 [bacterium]|nr:hypothetical protein [bacterium]